MTREDLIKLAKAKAEERLLDPALIAGLIEQESNWQVFAFKFEPQFFQKYISPLLERGTISHTEAMARATSWGLCQLLGESAREQGFGSPFLAELLDPFVNLEEGCKFFSAKLRQAEANVERALLLWNGGGRPAYVAEVLQKARAYRT